MENNIPDEIILDEEEDEDDRSTLTSKVSISSKTARELVQSNKELTAKLIAMKEENEKMKAIHEENDKKMKATQEENDKKIQALQEDKQKTDLQVAFLMSRFKELELTWGRGQRGGVEEWTCQDKGYKGDQPHV